MAYPTGTELADFLLNRGLITAIPGDLSDYDDLMTVVAAQWENDTGWHPFLADALVSTRKFSQRGGSQLFLNAGIPTSTGLIVSINDEDLTLDTDHWLRPSDVSNGWPWTQIETGFTINTAPNGIEITARFGFCTTLPALVTRALIQKGAAEWLRDFSNTTVGTAGAVVEMRQDDVMKKYAGSVATIAAGEYGGSLQQQFGNAYDRAVHAYGAPWLVMA